MLGGSAANSFLLAYAARMAAEIEQWAGEPALAQRNGEFPAGEEFRRFAGKRGQIGFRQRRHQTFAFAKIKRGGQIPAAGFFAMGEIGPVGGQNFLHGFTASVALFRGRSA